MARILILIVLAWILYQIIKRAISGNAKNQGPTQKNGQTSDKNRDEKMLQCTRCGCHVPESDTKVINEQIICNNPECRKVAHGD